MRFSDGAKSGSINLFLVIGASVSLGVLAESQSVGWLCFFMTLLVIRNL